MRDRLKKTFDYVKAQKRPAFISYVTAGDPDYRKSLEVIDTLVKSGIDILELGIPFSDPLADGETNQLSAQRALESGMTPLKSLEIVKEARNKYADLPIVLYTYLNPVAFAIDFRDFCRKASEAGADALLLLDLTPEEGKGYYRETIDESGLKLVSLVTPNTPPERLPVITGFATAFIYYVTREGVTGARKDFAAGIGGKISQIRGYTSLPVVTGFGISSAEHVRSARSSGTDGIVVGSAIVRMVGEYTASKSSLEKISSFVRQLTDACSGN